MHRFLSSLGIAPTELRLLDTASPARILATLAGTGEFEQGIWHLPSGESVAYEIVNWAVQDSLDCADACDPKADRTKDRACTLEEDQLIKDDNEFDNEAYDVAIKSGTAPMEFPLLDGLPPSCLARVAASLSLTDLARVCASSLAFRRLCGVGEASGDRGAIDACWLERIRSHFGPDYLRDCWTFASQDACCSGNPFARLYLHALLGLYRARPQELLEEQTREHLQQQQQRSRLVSDSSLCGALFPAPLLSPVFLGRPLSMEFNFAGVHPGRYDVLLRVKKLLCDPLDSEAVASAADNSGVRVPLLQARINRRSVTISNFECSIDVTSTPGNELNASSQAQPVLSASTVSHLLQNYSMQPDRWFYWRLATLDLSPDETGVTNLTARVSVMRRGVADATVTQEEFERELRNALLVDHLFLRPQPFPRLNSTCR